MNEKFLSTEDVAKKLGVTRRQVARLIEAGSLNAVRLGRDLFVNPEDLAAFKPIRRKKGRPRKSEE